MSSITKQFPSEKSKDLIEISYFEKSHKCNLFIKCVDDVFDNVRLVGTVITYLKKIDIKWVCLVFKSKEDIIIPENTVWFEHKYTSGVCCHIEDFDKFYITNLSNLLTSKLIYLPNTTSTNHSNTEVVGDDGWTIVLGINAKSNMVKQKKEKLDEIKKHLKELVSNE